MMAETVLALLLSFLADRNAIMPGNIGELFEAHYSINFSFYDIPLAYDVIVKPEVFDNIFVNRLSDGSNPSTADSNYLLLDYKLTRPRIILIDLLPLENQKQVIFDLSNYNSFIEKLSEAEETGVLDRMMNNDGLSMEQLSLLLFKPQAKNYSQTYVHFMNEITPEENEFCLCNFISHISSVYRESKSSEFPVTDFSIVILAGAINFQLPHVATLLIDHLHQNEDNEDIVFLMDFFEGVYQLRGTLNVNIFPLGRLAPRTVLLNRTGRTLQSPWACSYDNLEFVKVLQSVSSIKEVVIFDESIENSFLSPHIFNKTFSFIKSTQDKYNDKIIALANGDISKCTLLELLNEEECNNFNNLLENSLEEFLKKNIHSIKL